MIGIRKKKESLHQGFFFRQCGRGDLNSHRIKLPLEPESSASAIPPLPLDKWYSTIRRTVCKPLFFIFFARLISGCLRNSLAVISASDPVLYPDGLLFTVFCSRPLRMGENIPVHAGTQGILSVQPDLRVYSRSLCTSTWIPVEYDNTY